MPPSRPRGCSLRIRRALLLPLLLVSLLGYPLTASAVVADPIQMGDLAIARGVAEDGDLLVYFDYNLATGWEDDGTSTPAVPWPTGSALLRLLDTSTTPATVLQERASIVRNGEALGAFYLPGGHSAPAWGSADLQVMVMSNPTVFDYPPVQATTSAAAGSYVTTSWTTAGDDLMSQVSDDQDAYCSAVEELAKNVEAYTNAAPAVDLYETGDLVLRNSLTDVGSEVVVDAMPTIGSILTTCFSVGVTSTASAYTAGTLLNGDGSDSGRYGEVDKNLTNSLTSSAFWTDRFSPMASSLNFGGDGSILAVMLVFIAAIIAAVVGYTLSGSAAYASNVAAVFFFGGSFLAPWILQMAMIGIALLWLVMGTTIFARLPR